ncbi:MAG: hypothetical protein U9Q79_07560, partial [Candidatus Hydrogenedentes bacterium]|nr:hypothetical protein [Candidatus Hydrogenedentota bacterium]
MERGRAGNTSGESRENAAVVCARLHLSGIGALASHGLEQLRLAEIHLLTLATEPSNTEALEAVARVFCNLRKAARRLKLRDLHYYVADQERLLRDGLDACFFSERSLDAILNTIGVLKKYLAYMKEVLAGSDTLPSPKLLPALRRSAQSSVTPQRATPSVSPQDPRKRLGEMLMASGDISAGDLQEALFQCEGFNGHKRLGELLLEEVRLSREQLERAIQEQ